MNVTIDKEYIEQLELWTKMDGYKHLRSTCKFTLLDVYNTYYDRVAVIHVENTDSYNSLSDIMQVESDVIQSISISNLESWFRYNMVKYCYIPVFEIRDLKSVEDLTWHAPIFKSLNYTIENIIVDYSNEIVESFDIKINFIIEEVSKGYEYS